MQPFLPQAAIGLMAPEVCQVKTGLHHKSHCHRYVSLICTQQEEMLVHENSHTTCHVRVYTSTPSIPSVMSQVTLQY